MDEVCPGLPQRVHDVVDEPNLVTWSVVSLMVRESTCYLRLLYSGVVSVAHGRDVQPGLPLSVALLEELLHDPVHPVVVQLQGLGGVGQVSAVDHVLQHLNPVRVVVQEQHAGPRHLLGLHHGLEVCQQAHVFRHVCSQNLQRGKLDFR